MKKTPKETFKKSTGLIIIKIKKVLFYLFIEHNFTIYCHTAII